MVLSAPYNVHATKTLPAAESAEENDWSLFNAIVADESLRTPDRRIDLSAMLIPAANAEIAKQDGEGMILPISDGHNAQRGKALSFLAFAIPLLLAGIKGASLKSDSLLWVSAWTLVAGLPALGLAAAGAKQLLQDARLKDHRNGIMLDTNETRFTERELQKLWEDKKFVSFKAPDQAQSSPRVQAPPAI